MIQKIDSGAGFGPAVDAEFAADFFHALAHVPQAIGGSGLRRAVKALAGVFDADAEALIGTTVNGSVTGTAAIDIGVPNEVNLGVISAKPRVASFSLSGTNLLISGSNETPGVSCGVLSSTNLTLPLAQWTPVVRNVLFEGSGNFNTNIVVGSHAQQLLIIRSPSP
jgi:hypothetical protein